MWKDAILITLSCTLFVQMGLSDAIQRVTRLRSKVFSCPRCLSFWLCLGYLAVSGCRVIESVAASFLFSYLSLWLALIYDALASLYNQAYDHIAEAGGGAEDAPADSNKGAEAPPGDEVSDVQQ